MRKTWVSAGQAFLSQWTTTDHQPTQQTTITRLVLFGKVRQVLTKQGFKADQISQSEYVVLMWPNHHQSDSCFVQLSQVMNIATVICIHYCEHVTFLWLFMFSFCVCMGSIILLLIDELQHTSGDRLNNIILHTGYIMHWCANYCKSCLVFIF